MNTKFAAIMHKLIFRRNGEVGQSIVIMTLAVIAMIAFAALVFDGGMGYAQRRHMQNAADAGAMAGARALTQDSPNCTSLWAKINEYAMTRNGAEVAEAYYLRNGNVKDNSQIPQNCGNIPNNVEGIAVIAKTSFKTFFAGLFGEKTGGVAAEAIAHFGVVNAPPPNALQPLARRCDNTAPNQDGVCGFQFGVQYDIWTYGGSGNLGWLDWTNGSCGNATCTAQELTPGYNISNYVDPTGGCTIIAVNCWVAGNSGVSNSSDIGTQFDAWQLNGFIGKPMTIIVWDQSTSNGANLRYHILGFAAFVLQAYDLSGGHIIGEFVRWTCASCGVCVQGCYNTYFTAAGLMANDPPTPTATLTGQPTSTNTPIPTPINSPTATRTPTKTNTPNPSYSPTATRTFTPTPTSTNTPTNTPTLTFTPTGTPPTSTPTPTYTPTPTSLPYAAIGDSKSAVSVSLSGSTEPITMAHEGEAVQYRIYVRNTGNATLTNVTVADNLTNINASLGTMLPQMSQTVIVTYSIPYNAKNPLVNTATAQGYPPSGPAVKASASYTITLLHPNIKLTKTASTNNPSVGDTVTYTFKIENTGDTTLNNVVLTDQTLFPSSFGPQPCSPYSYCVGPLAAGIIWTLNYPYVVPQGTSGTTINNTAFVNGQDPLNRNVEAFSSTSTNVR